MSIPKYAFVVEAIYQEAMRFKRTYNYETLDGAYAHSANLIRKRNVVSVRVLCVLDERKAMHDSVQEA